MSRRTLRIDYEAYDVRSSAKLVIIDLDDESEQWNENYLNQEEDDEKIWMIEEREREMKKREMKKREKRQKDKRGEQKTKLIRTNDQ